MSTIITVHLLVQLPVHNFPFLSPVPSITSIKTPKSRAVVVVIPAWFLDIIILVLHQHGL